MKSDVLTALALVGAGAALASSTALSAVTLISPNGGKKTTLIDSSGNTIATFTHKLTGGYSAYLTDSGTIIRSAIPSTGNTLEGDGAPQGAVEETDANGNQVRVFTYSNDSVLMHHAIWVMPNGHVLGLVFEKKTATQVSAAGLGSKIMYPDKIVEFDKTGNVVWQWHFWDHMVGSDSASSYPGRISKGLLTNTYPQHANSVSYDPVHDLIVVSSHYLNEVYVIDHSTTTAEAATEAGGNYGKGGTILFRWGCPSNYGASGTQYINVVHGANFVDSGFANQGNILLYANADPSLSSSSSSTGGQGGPGGQGGSSSSSYSHSFEIEPTLDASGNFTMSSGAFVWTMPWNWYRTESKYQSSGNFGMVQRLPNGNTFIDNAKGGAMVEVDSAGNILWEYDGTSGTSRAMRYPYWYKGLSSYSIYRDSSSSGSTGISRSTGGVASFRLFLRGDLLTMDNLGTGALVRVTDAAGCVQFAGRADGELALRTSSWGSGVHFVQVAGNGSVSCRTFGIVR